MPYVINGIGTWNYGKRGLRQHEGVCPNCGFSGLLSRYESTRYFVIFLVPVIPLGSRRVSHHCPQCNTWREVTERKWRAEKARACKAALDDYHDAPRDADSVKEVLFTFAAFENVAGLRELVPELERNFSSDPRILEVLGDVHAAGADYEAAEGFYRRALEIEDSEDLREALAVVCIHTRRPDEARPLLAHIVEHQHADRAGRLVFLAEGFQATGDHESALDVLNEVETILPGAASDKEFRKLRRVSEKNRASGKPVLAAALGGGSDTGFDAGSFFGRWGLPLLLLIGFAIFAAVAWWKGGHREIWLINGLPVVYTATFDDEQVQLYPGRPTLVTVPEGELRVSVSDLPVRIPEQSIEIRTAFFDRPFDRSTWVVNPDSAAVVIWKKAYYGTDVNNLPDPEFRLNAGKNLYHFENISFPFKPFLDEIHSSSSGIDERTGLEALDPDEVDIYLLSALADQQGEQAMVEVARAMLPVVPAHPNATTYAGVLAANLTGEEFEAIIRPLLEQRPVVMGLHRLYQSFIEGEQPDRDIAEDYQKLLEKSPDDPNLIYLAARAQNDPVRQEAMLRDALARGVEGDYVRYLLAYLLTSQGLHDEALEHLRQTTNDAMPDLRRDELYLELLRRTGRIEEMLAEAEKMEPPDFALGYFDKELEAAFALGGMGLARKQKAKQLARLQDQEVDLETVEEEIEFVLSYWEEDSTSYYEAIKQLGEANHVMTHAIGVSDFENARAAAEELDEWNAWRTLALAEAVANGPEAAQGDFERMKQSLAEGSRSDRQLARLLADPVAQFDHIRAVGIQPREKAELLALLGALYPDRLPEAPQLALQIWPEYFFPHHLLARAAGRQPFHGAGAVAAAAEPVTSAAGPEARTTAAP